MNSANARDCLLHLNRLQLNERADLVQLNDQFVDIVEHAHYLEAENAALLHDYNLLTNGKQVESIGINEIFQTEIRNVRGAIDETNRIRQQLLSEQTFLSQQVKETEQKWKHTARAALGVPKDVDEYFIRLCQIKMEDCITKRRIKYMEGKIGLLKQNNGKIYEQINLMKMRTDRAVNLKQEYATRKNELFSSIRNMEEENKKTIMNEHKYFTRDRNADRNVFHSQLRQAIDEIRADYELRRVRNEDEIRVRLEREIHRINSQYTRPTHDHLREEISIVKSNVKDLQQQVSAVELRNLQLTHQIEQDRLIIAENHQSFEASLEIRIKEIEKMKEQCTKINVELEKLCDLNINLQQEIARYRELLDRSATAAANLASSSSAFVSNVSRPNIQQTTHQTTHLNRAAQDSGSAFSSSSTGTIIQHIQENTTPRVLTPAPAADETRRIQTSRDSTSDYRISRVYPAVPTVSQPTFQEPRFPIQPTLPEIIPPPPSQRITDVGFTYGHSSSIRPPSQSIDHRISSIYPLPPPRPIPTLPTGNKVIETSAQSHRTYGQYGTEHSSHHHSRQETDHSLSNSAYTTADIQRVSSVPYQPYRTEATAATYLNEGEIEHISSTNSVDEENFQRFTRWYKGRVKISDVTPDYVQLENRSSKKSSDIGGFRLIHEFGHRSVYVDFPVGLILAPKQSLKIFARNAQHEYGQAVVAEIDYFDTTIDSNTSIRNTNNEVRSWFVYTSNTEIGDAQHHHN